MQAEWIILSTHLSNLAEERRLFDCVPSCKSRNWVLPLNLKVEPRRNRLLVEGLFVNSVFTVLERTEPHIPTTPLRLSVLGLTNLYTGNPPFFVTMHMWYTPFVILLRVWIHIILCTYNLPEEGVVLNTWLPQGLAGLLRWACEHDDFSVILVLYVHVANYSHLQGHYSCTWNPQLTEGEIISNWSCLPLKLTAAMRTLCENSSKHASSNGHPHNMHIMSTLAT